MTLSYNAALRGAPASGPSDVIPAALRDKIARRVVLFSLPAALDSTFTEDGPLERVEYCTLWRSWGSELTTSEVVQEVETTDPSSVIAWLALHRVYYVIEGPRVDPSLSALYFPAAALDPASGTPGGVAVLAEVTFKAGLPKLRLVVKTQGGPEPLGRLAAAAIKALLGPRRNDGPSSLPGQCP